jgi:hypothetical protein
MSMKCLVPLAILAMVGVSTTAFAAHPSDDMRRIHHRHHVVMHHQVNTEGSTYGNFHWNLPQGWPHTPN